MSRPSRTRYCSYYRYIVSRRELRRKCWPLHFGPKRVRIKSTYDFHTSSSYEKFPSQIEDRSPVSSADATRNVSVHTFGSLLYTLSIKMKTAVLATLISAAAAFAPAKQAAQTTSLSAFESELGAQEPLGFYDPLGFLVDADQERFDRLRYVELKHGRIAMLAFLGQITTRAGLHLPGSVDLEGNSFDSFPDGAAALFGEDAIPTLGLGQIVGFIGILELAVMKDVTGEGEFPGDFRNGALDFGWDTFGPQTKLRKRAIELNNGRAAMMGILGLMMHEQIDGNPVIGVFIGY
jgi:hypothetical protein